MHNQRIAVLFTRAVQAFPLVLGAALWAGCEGQQSAFDTTTPTHLVEGVEQPIKGALQ